MFKFTFHILIGFLVKEECDTWPVQQCSMEKKLVQKYTPETSCQQEPREMCAPTGCQLVEVSGSGNKFRTIILCTRKCSGHLLPEQDQGCDHQQPHGGVRVGAQEGLQTDHQDGSSTEISEGVCGCSQGGVRHVQSQPRQEKIPHH